MDKDQRGPLSGYSANDRYWVMESLTRRIRNPKADINDELCGELVWLAARR